MVTSICNAITIILPCAMKCIRASLVRKVIVFSRVLRNCQLIISYHC